MTLKRGEVEGSKIEDKLETISSGKDLMIDGHVQFIMRSIFSLCVGLIK